MAGKEARHAEFQAVVEEIGDAGTAKITETATGEWGPKDGVVHGVFWEDFLSKMANSLARRRHALSWV